MNDTSSLLLGLADHLAARRGDILEAWRRAGMVDPEQPTAHSLSRAQFYDHIPDFLAVLESRLRERAARVAPATDARPEEVKHGLQRWQQGYHIEELMHEWWNLHSVLLQELESYAQAHPESSAQAQLHAAREIINLIHEGVTESAAQYSHLERSDAAGHLRDLEKAVASLRQLEQHRAGLIHEAVHDLRGNVQSVTNLAELLRIEDLPAGERADFAELLQSNIETVASLIQDLMELARLESGKERRKPARFDAAKMLTEHCAVHLARAQAKNLYLRTAGPDSLVVFDDAGKIRRLVQNLIVNALNYTQHGGVTVSWGEEEKHWWVRIQDTGPGLMGGPGAPLVKDLSNATASAREADERGAAAAGAQPRVLAQAEIGPKRPAPHPRQLPGEGIGLSIVKRLCELLDASVEVVSSGEHGTIIRVVFPRHDDIDSQAPIGANI